jgi:hypothetical protein
LSIRARIAALERKAARLGSQKRQPEERAAVRYLEVVRILLEAFERTPEAEVQEEQRAGRRTVLDRMREALALVGEYVAGGRISAHLEYHCSGMLNALSAWWHQQEGDIPRPFPFEDQPPPPNWGGPRNEMEHLRQCLEIDHWQLGEEWYQGIRLRAGPAAVRPFDVNMGRFLD